MKLYPEVRGSHLAGRHERARARKRLERLGANRRAQEAAKDMNQTNEQTSRPTNGAQVPKRRSGHGRAIGSDDRDSIMGEIARRGRDAVETELRKLIPDKTLQAVSCMIHNVMTSPEHRWSSTSRSALQRFASFCREGGQRSFPLPNAPFRAPAVSLAAPSGQPTNGAPDLVTLLATVLGPVLQQLGFGPQGAQSAPIPALPAFASADPPDMAIKPFSELEPPMQRNIITSMHTRYATRLKKHYGIPAGEHAAAWKISYEAYDKRTGKRVCERASEVSDSTGARVRPLDIIERDGDLVRFWLIVREVWEQGAQ